MTWSSPRQGDLGKKKIKKKDKKISRELFSTSTNINAILRAAKADVQREMETEIHRCTLKRNRTLLACELFNVESA